MLGDGIPVRIIAPTNDVPGDLQGDLPRQGDDLEHYALQIARHISSTRSTNLSGRLPRATGLIPPALRT